MIYNLFEFKWANSPILLRFVLSLSPPHPRTQAILLSGKCSFSDLKEISIDIKVNGNSIPKNQSFERKSDNKIIKFIIDDNLKPGECIIETDNNIIDATFKTQIQNLINDL